MLPKSLQNIFTNAIVLGILAFAVSYGYMYWEEKNKAKKRKSKKTKRVDIFIPGIVGAIVWLASSYYFDKEDNKKINDINNENLNLIDEPLIGDTQSNNKNILKYTKNRSLQGGKIDSDNIKIEKCYKSKVGRIDLPDENVFLDII